MRITPIQIQITPVQPYRPVYRGNSPVQYADLLNRISGYRENGRPKIWALTQSEIFEILKPKQKMGWEQGTFRILTMRNLTIFLRMCLIH